MKQITVDAMSIYYFQYLMYYYFQRIAGNLEGIVFILAKFPFAFLLGLNYLFKANSVYLPYKSTLYCSNHVFQF